METLRERENVEASEEEKLSARLKHRKEDGEFVKSDGAVSKTAEPSQPNLPIFNFKNSETTKYCRDELESSQLSFLSNAAARELNGSMPSRPSGGERALSLGDAVRPATAMSRSNVLVVKRGGTHRQAASFQNPLTNSLADDKGTASTNEEQPPEPLIESAVRVPRERKSRHRQSTAEFLTQLRPKKITPHSSLEKLPDLYIRTPRDLSAAKQTPKKHSDASKGLRRQKAPDFFEFQPALTPSGSELEGTTLHSAPGDLEDSCSPEPTIGQGRQERSPRPKEMTGCAFKPVNRLGNGTGSPSLSSANASKKLHSSAGSQNPADLDPSPKRQRRESHTVSSAGSSVKLNGGSEDYSNTARNEAPIERKSGGNRRYLSTHKYNAVSRPLEHQATEALASLEQPTRQKKRRPVEQSYPYPVKKQCLDNGGVKDKTSSRMKNQQDSSIGNILSRSDEDDSIDSTPPPRYTSTTRPRGAQVQNGIGGSKGNPTRPEYFEQQSRHKPAPSSHINGHRNTVIRNLVDGSEDELAGGAPTVPSKSEASRIAGTQLLSTYCKKDSPIQDLPSRADIPKTKFASSKPSNGIASMISFGLSRIVAGNLLFNHRENADTWHLVLNPEEKIFEPFKNGVSVADEEVELIVDPANVRTIQYTKGSKKIYIQRRGNHRQKALSISVEFGESSDPSHLIQCLQDLDPKSGYNVTNRPTSEDLDKKFDTLWIQVKTRAADKTKSKALQSEEIQYIERRTDQRRIKSQQNSNKPPSVTKLSKRIMNGIADGFKHSSRTIDLEESDEELVSRTVLPRRNTRAATQEQKAAISTNGSAREILPPKPEWTIDHPDWRDRWGLPTAQLSYPAAGKDKALVDLQDIERLNEGQFLNDNLISFYLRYLQEKLQRKSPETAQKIHFHNTFFYKSLTTGGSTKSGINYDAVKRWTLKIDLFSKEFIVVPINENYHWYLAIIYKAPALNPPKREASPNIKPIPAPAGIHGTRGVQSKTTRTQQTIEQHQNSVLQPSENDLLGLEKMSISGTNHHIREGSGELPNKQRIVTEIPESPPNSPRRASPNSSSLVGGNCEATPKGEEQVNGSSTPNLRLSSPKNKKKRSKSVSAPSNESKAFIVILDSLGYTHPSTMSNLKDYLIAEAEAKLDLSVEKTSIGTSRTKSYIPEQTNSCDCGLFLLGYTEKFLDDPTLFVQSLLKHEMRVETHWDNLDASEMRGKIRDLIFSLKGMQDSHKKASSKMTSNSLASGKDRVLEHSSRETSVQSGRPRRSPDSPGKQHRIDQSRPTSSSSQNGFQNSKTPLPLLPQYGGIGKDSTTTDKSSPIQQKADFVPSKKSLSQTIPVEILGLSPKPKVFPGKIVPSSSIKKRSRSTSDVVEVPSMRSRSSSVILEQPLLQGQRSSAVPTSRASSPKHYSQGSNTVPTSRRGSPNNPIDVNEDEALPSSSGILATVDPVHIDRMQTRQARPKEPSRDIRAQVLDDSEVIDSQEAGGSSDVMLLDGEDTDDFLNHPVAAMAAADDLSIPGSFPFNEKPNDTSTIRTSGRAAREAPPSPNLRGTLRGQTYSQKRKRGRSAKKSEVVNVEDD